jgi:hypothetical protein
MDRPPHRLMMVAVRTSETSVNIYMTTRQYIPQDSKLPTRNRENLKSHTEELMHCDPPMWTATVLWSHMVTFFCFKNVNAWSLVSARLEGADLDHRVIYWDSETAMALYSCNSCFPRYTEMCALLLDSLSLQPIMDQLPGSVPSRETFLERNALKPYYFSII